MNRFTGDGRMDRPRFQLDSLTCTHILSRRPWWKLGQVMWRCYFFPDQLMTVVAYITKAIGNGKFCECGSVHIQKPYGVVARASSLL